MSESMPQSDRLYNKELSPETASGTWKTINLFNWWMSGWHSLGGYTMAIGLFVFGITGWQVILAFTVGVVILYFANNLSGVAGQREKVPFPVFARGAFGIFGANIPAILRAIVAIAWYGIQTYLASAAIMLLVLKVAPGAMPLTESSFLGLSTLGWICFLILSAIQLIVLLSGMEAIRRLSDFAGPTIWIAMIALAIWMLARADWSINLNDTVSAVQASPNMQMYGILASIFLTVAYFAGPSLNFADFTRNAPTEAAVRKGNALGLLINATAFGIISVVIALAAVQVYGDAIHDPIVLLGDIDSIVILLIAVIAVALATAGINIILNYVAPVYDIINVWPRTFTFKTAGAVVAVLAIVILPWNLFSNPVLVNQFIGGVGALMGPLLGILATDYYLIQGKRLHTEELFTESTEGRYFYRHGYNPKAIWSLVVAGGITIIMSIIPAISMVAPFAWPVGVIVSGGLYFILNRNNRVSADEQNVEEPAVV
jgi:NCS1 family nucleobase:cation symporter-1